MNFFSFKVQKSAALKTDRFWFRFWWNQEGPCWIQNLLLDPITSNRIQVLESSGPGSTSTDQNPGVGTDVFQNQNFRSSRDLDSSGSGPSFSLDFGRVVVPSKSASENLNSEHVVDPLSSEPPLAQLGFHPLTRLIQNTWDQVTEPTLPDDARSSGSSLWIGSGGAAEPGSEPGSEPQEGRWSSAI